MHKNTYAILSAIAISAILLTSFTMVGMQFSQRASAQQTSSPPSANSSMAAGPSANSSMAAGPSANSSSASTQATAEPTSGQSFVWQGTASSEPSPLPGHEKDYVAYILQPRSDKSVYSGVLTYSVSRSEGAKGWPNVEIWHTFSPGNRTAIPSSFGVMKTATFNKMPIALTDLSSSGSAGSVPFSGNAVLLHASSPFIVAYTVTQWLNRRKLSTTFKPQWHNRHQALACLLAAVQAALAAVQAALAAVQAAALACLLAAVQVCT